MPRSLRTTKKRLNFWSWELRSTPTLTLSIPLLSTKFLSLNIFFFPDLTEASLFVLLVGVHPLIAYALVLEARWYDSNVAHSGVHSTLNYSQNTPRIIGGRELVKKV